MKGRSQGHPKSQHPHPALPFDIRRAVEEPKSRRDDAIMMSRRDEEDERDSQSSSSSPPTRREIRTGSRLGLDKRSIRDLASGMRTTTRLAELLRSPRLLHPLRREIRTGSRLGRGREINTRSRLLYRCPTRQIPASTSHSWIACG